MQSQIHGTISMNMVKRAWNSEFSYLRYVRSLDDGMITKTWSLHVSYRNEYDKVHRIKERECSSKKIKTILLNIKEIALTVNDIEVIQQNVIETKPFYDKKIFLEGGIMYCSLLKTQEPKEILSKLLLDTELLSDYVIWSVCLCNNNSSDFFLCNRHLSYQDFLIYFLKNFNGNKACKIDFELYIFSIPLLFGKATCTIMSEKSQILEKSFFFSRMLVCSDLAM